MERADIVRYSKQVVPVGEVLAINIVILAMTIIQLMILKNYRVRPYLTPTIKFIHYMYFQIFNIFMFAEATLAVILFLAFKTHGKQLFDIFFNYERSVIYGGFVALLAVIGIMVIAYIDESFT